MTRLALASTILGALIVAGRLPGVLFPEKFREFALKFPRSVWLGRVLMAIAAVWVWIVMYHAATDEWAWARPLIVIGIPVAYWLVIQFGETFLAVRATAALMLLIAKIMVDATDASELASRLVVTVLAYLWVVAAAWMTIAPHQLRDAIQFMMANNTRCRLACSIGAAVGALLLALGMFVY
jgi:hypothetical protein